MNKISFTILVAMFSLVFASGVFSQNKPDAGKGKTESVGKPAEGSVKKPTK